MPMSAFKQEKALKLGPKHLGISVYVFTSDLPDTDPVAGKLRVQAIEAEDLKTFRFSDGMDLLSNPRQRSKAT